MKTLILGLGNIIRGDDAVGLLCVEKLKQRNTGNSNYDFKCLHTSGISLVDTISGYKKTILVDAVKTAGGIPGTVFWTTVGELPDPRSDRSYHDIHINDAIVIGRKLNMKMPVDIEILGIEVVDYDSWCEGLSLEAEQGLNKAIVEVENKIK